MSGVLHLISLFFILILTITLPKFAGMKRLAVILLVPIMLLQSCAGLFMMTVFYANRDYIAKNLCDYRNRPVSTCGGSCVLAESLKKEQEREEKQPDLKFKEIQLLLNHATNVFTKTPVMVTVQQSYATYIKPIYTIQFTSTIFHPPLA
jgi:flagellar basal body-associated protein FliL